MKHENLTDEQKYWIGEIQRDFSLNEDQFLYCPNVVCDSENGRVYRCTAGFLGGREIWEGEIGRLPLKAIPFRRKKRVSISMRNVQDGAATISYLERRVEKT
tara:strand:- start:4334 stop:4639 length:306 start_codon:yes stop_codon:yes gene_type:complete